jgi:hypothetical protein
VQNLKYTPAEPICAPHHANSRQLKIALDELTQMALREIVYGRLRAAGLLRSFLAPLRHAGQLLECLLFGGRTEVIGLRSKRRD